MTKSDLTYRADQLLAKDRIRTPKEQIKLVGILLEIEGLNIKITGHDNVKKNQVPRIRRKKKYSNNLQLKLTF